MLIGVCLYIGTTIYVFYNSIQHWKKMDRRLKADGYKMIGNKGSRLENIFLLSLGVIVHLIPIFHLIFPIINHDEDRSYDSYKNYLEEAGSIEQIEPTKSFYNKKLEKVTGIGYISGIDNTLRLIKEVNDIEEKKIITIGESTLKERISRNGHIYYSSMGIDEEDTLDIGYTYKKTLK